MRYQHFSIVSSKEAFSIRLSYILQHLNKTETQRSIAEYCGVSTSTISAICNEHVQCVSLNTLMKIADKLKLNYEVVFKGNRGKVSNFVTVESAVDYMKLGKLNPVRKNVMKGNSPAFKGRVATH